MKKRNMTALVLASIMALSTTGTALASVRFADSPSLYSASAAETGAKEVASADELKAALEAGGAVKLTEDIIMAEKYDISITEGVVLDLNGHTITKSYGESNHFIFVINGGSLTIEDSKGGGKIEATDSSYGYGIQLRSGSSFELKSGTIETTQETVDIYTSASDVNVKISGGKLESTADSVLGVRGNSGIKVDITGGEMVSNGRTGVYISSYTPGAIEFNFSGGKLSHTGGMSGAIQAYSGATINISGDAEIESDSSAGIQVQGDSAKVELNVTGGSISSTGWMDAAIVADGDAPGNAVVNISGGNLNGTYGVSAEGFGEVNISGGTVTGTMSAIDAEDNSEVVVTGGTFSDDVKDYVPDGIIVEEDGNGNFVVTDPNAKPDPKPDTPDEEDRPAREYSDYYGNEKWDEVKREIAKLIEDGKSGETIEMSATGLPYFPSSVARALKGQDITLEVRKNGVTYSVNGLKIGSIDKIWYEFENLETELLTADEEKDEASSQSTDEDKTNPDTGR